METVPEENGNNGFRWQQNGPFSFDPEGLPEDVRQSVSDLHSLPFISTETVCDFCLVPENNRVLVLRTLNDESWGVFSRLELWDQKECQRIGIFDFSDEQHRCLLFNRNGVVMVDQTSGTVSFVDITKLNASGEYLPGSDHPIRDVCYLNNPLIAVQLFNSKVYCFFEEGELKNHYVLEWSDSD